MSTYKLTPEKETTLLSMYTQGANDAQIAKTLQVSKALVCQFRRKHNLPSKFLYDSIAKIHKKDFEPLFYQGLGDQEIANRLKVSVDGVYSFRQRNNYTREDYRVNKSIPIPKKCLEVLVGTLLGDASLVLYGYAKNPTFMCAHSPKQREYTEYKASLLKELGARIQYVKMKTPDPRNGKLYEQYKVVLPANPELLPIYKAFYPNGKKTIPMELMDNFTELSLALLFMDDGFKQSNSYGLATICFSKQEVNNFRALLLIKFDIETTIESKNITHILSKSRKHFEELINPYICECMKYKLQ